MINAALPLYVWGRREDGGEPRSISILAVLLQESALSLCRCSAAFQITEKTHQTLHFGFTPSRAVCCFLMKPVDAFMESFLVSVYVVSTSISCIDSWHLSKLVANCCLFYWCCWFCFSEGRERPTGSDLPGKSDFHHGFKSFMLYQAAKSLWGHYLGLWLPGCGRCVHSTLKRHWADRATLDNAQTVQSYNLKHKQSNLQIHSHHFSSSSVKHTVRKEVWLFHLTQIRLSQKQKRNKTNWAPFIICCITVL